MPRVMLPVIALWKREMLRFVRQRSRIFGAFAQPLLFWVLLGSGFNASFRPAGAGSGSSYSTYFYPGTIAMVLLFTAIFSTISTVEDRKAGFLQGVLVSPVPRWAVVLGQVMGGTTLAVVQGILFLLLAPIAGVTLTLPGVILSIIVMKLIALALTSLGLIIAWRMESTQGFHAIMNLILLPIWFLSGAFFPAAGAPAPMRLVMNLNPLTYGVAALRRALYWGTDTDLSNVAAFGPSVVITIIFCIVTFAIAVRTAERR